MTISTRQGDDGSTRLASGEKISKASERMEAIGDIDELVSVLGVTACHLSREETAASIMTIQRTLMRIAGILAAPGRQSALALEQAELDELGDRCWKLEASVEVPTDFVVPGGSLSSAHLDCARAVARRCERALVRLQGKREPGNERLVAWMNRLSDYLWLLARRESADGHTGT